MKELCVVHLVRAHNGIEPFKRFLESYQSNPGGIEHDLLLVFKGFSSVESKLEYLNLLVPYRYCMLDVEDIGFDIAAYFSTIERYAGKYHYFCFLNSYSVILDHDWLNKLYQYISKAGVGLVGASGSWNSNCSNAFSWFQRGAAVVLGLQRKKKRVTTKVSENSNPNNTWEKIQYIGRAVTTNIQLLLYFNPFPNYHIRTNAFMIAGTLMKSLDCPILNSKMGAYRFESGKGSITNQIIRRGLRVIVVGKNGVGYEKEQWHESGTFWQSDQENLLVADNQTLEYQLGSLEKRHFLTSISWGATLGNGNG